MRVLLVPAFAVVLLGAGDPPYSALDNPAYTNPPEASEILRDATGRDLERPQIQSAEHETCRDRISEARESARQPPLLQREPASPDKPLAIYAVERTQDGCSVMVMMGDREDIRTLPLPAETSERVIPARSQTDER